MCFLKEELVALSNLIRELEQISFVGAVLAGFSLSLFAGLLHKDPGRRITGISAWIALSASTLLVTATISGVAGVVSGYLVPQPQAAVFDAFNWAACSFLPGMFAFLACLCLSGWTRSRKFGIATKALTGTALVALSFFLVSVVGAI